jgi:hypothetical protein
MSHVQKGNGVPTAIATVSAAVAQNPAGNKSVRAPGTYLYT